MKICKSGVITSWLFGREIASLGYLDAKQRFHVTKYTEVPTQTATPRNIIVLREIFLILSLALTARKSFINKKTMVLSFLI